MRQSFLVERRDPPRRPAELAGNGSGMVVPQSFGADLSLSYDPGDVVEHRKWGRGTIVSTNGHGESLELMVRFEEPIGERKLFAKFAPIVKV